MCTTPVSICSITHRNVTEIVRPFEVNGSQHAPEAFDIVARAHGCRLDALPGGSQVLREGVLDGQSAFM